MKRKINKVGPGTLTVSLPKNWAEKNRLDKGDILEIEEKGSSLIIYSSKKHNIKRIEVNLPAHKPTILRILFHAYRSGVDEILFTFDNPEYIKTIEERIGELIGYEIVEQKDNSIFLKSITDINDQDFEKAFKRFFDITIYFSKRVFENFSNGDFNSLSNTVVLEKTQNKLHFYSLRALSIFKDNLNEMPQFYYHLVQKLENIGDSYKLICNHYNKNHPKSISKESMKFFKDVNEILEHIHDMYFNFNIEKNIHLYESKESYMEKAKKLLLSQPKDNLFLISTLGKIIIDTYDASQPIFGINFDKLIQKPPKAR